MTDERALEVLVEHVLLTSRNGFAACASEGCDWEDKFYPSRDVHAPLVPLHIRLSHARHQHELLEELYCPWYAKTTEETPRGGW